MTQVYAMRSAASWGMGDLHDLATLASWSGRELGAGFVLINPLHAASPVPPMSPSPYLPVTRRFANPMYLRIEDVPEYARLAPAVCEQVEQLAGQLRRLNTTADLLDRDAVWGAKRTALEAIHQMGVEGERRADYEAFCAAEGVGLRDFATWCAISDVHGGVPADWPADLGHPASPAVAAFRDEHAGLVDFHMWLQWLIDEQMSATQQAARDAGMAIGVMHDLAVGVHPEGSDAWALQDVLAPGVGVGAPPDMYNQMGQNWHQPPWRPDALAEAAFVPYRDMLRTVLGHAGGLRIDHVLGLFRLWWVPEDFPAYAGTFVRFDYDAMLSILMLEAHRAGAIVVGEDLGTVEPWVQEVLAERGILGTQHPVVRDGRGRRHQGPVRLAARGAGQRDRPRPAPHGRLPARRARADPRRSSGCSPRRRRPSGPTPTASGRPGPTCCAGTAGWAGTSTSAPTRGWSPSRSPCTARSPSRPPGSSASRCPTSSAIGAPRTSPAPTRSTPTGGCR